MSYKHNQKDIGSLKNHQVKKGNIDQNTIRVLKCEQQRALSQIRSTKPLQKQFSVQEFTIELTKFKSHKILIMYEYKQILKIVNTFKSQ